MVQEHELEVLKLDEEKVKALFETSNHQADVIVGIYRMVYPDGLWDRIKVLKKWPEVNGKTGNELMCMFMDFDRKHHPNVIPGGAWLNNGFSSANAEDLPDWHVRQCDYTLKGEEETNV